MRCLLRLPVGRCLLRPRAGNGLAAALLLGSLAAPATPGAEMRSLDVERDGARYSVRSHTVIDAPVEAVFDVLADYDHLHELSSVFEETRVVARSDDRRRQVVYLRARGCVMFFCKTLERFEALTLDRPSRITAVAVAEPGAAEPGAATERIVQSDQNSSREERIIDHAFGQNAESGQVKRGNAGAPDRRDDIGRVSHYRSRWQLDQSTDGTHVRYAMEMEPDFWVPPLVGPWALKRKLAAGAGDAADRLERRARDLMSAHRYSPAADRDLSTVDRDVPAADQDLAGMDGGLSTVDRDSPADEGPD